jgi:hypothetical protein
MRLLAGICHSNRTAVLHEGAMARKSLWRGGADPMSCLPLPSSFPIIFPVAPTETNRPGLPIANKGFVATPGLPGFRSQVRRDIFHASDLLQESLPTHIVRTDQSSTYLALTCPSDAALLLGRAFAGARSLRNADIRAKPAPDFLESFLGRTASSRL